MKISNGTMLAAAATLALLLAGPDSQAQGNCISEGNHTIQVEEGADGTPVLTYRGESAEEVHVCVGDTVQWVLRGSNRSFLVDFFAGAPFPGAAKRGSSDNVVSVTIGDVERRAYDYGVEFANGPAMDPRIVVD